MIRILIVENEAAEGRHMVSAMQALGYTTVLAADSRQAMQELEQASVQLIVAGYHCGGAELCTELRDAGDTIPLLVTAKELTRADKRRIFRAGADGYLALPIDPEELQMRVQNLLWRCRIVDSATLRFGSCCLHAGTLSLVTPEGDIPLRRMEFLLLEKLLSYPGRVFTRAQLMDELWGFDSQSDPRTVDTHIRRLRKKLRDVEDIRLLTVRGLGYRAAAPRRLRRGERE